MGVDKNIFNRYFVDDLVKEQMLHLQKKIRELICSNLTLKDENKNMMEKIKKDQECIEELINGQKDSKIVEDLKMKIIKAEDKIQMLSENVDKVNREKKDLETSLERLKSLLIHSNSEEKKIERKEPDSKSFKQYKMLNTKVTMWKESSSNIAKETNLTDLSAETNIDELLDDIDNVDGKDTNTNLDELFDDSSATVGAPVEVKKEDVEVQTVKKTRKKTRRAKCQCEPCTRPPCNVCRECRDSPRNGGPGILRQRCKERQCTGQSGSFKKSPRKKEKRMVKNGKQRGTKNSSYLSCPMPKCCFKGKKLSRRSHIASHFTDLIQKNYPWKKNSPCPICDNVIHGNRSNYVAHMSYVHKVVRQLLPVDDKRNDVAVKYFS